MTRTIRGLLESFLFPLCKLNQIQFRAPWRSERQGC